MGESFPSSRGLVIGGVPCGTNSLLKASSLLLLQVLSCFFPAWSLSHSPKPISGAASSSRIGLEGIAYRVFDNRNGHLRPDHTSARNGR
jgi:hypothetical protein